MAVDASDFGAGAVLLQDDQTGVDWSAATWLPRMPADTFESKQREPLYLTGS